MSRIAASLARGTKERPREVVHRCCGGLDVHKDTVTAGVAWAEATGKKRHEKRQFGTTTRELLARGDWMQGYGVTHVAMESTGVDWQPVWHVLDGQFELRLVNAQHVTAIPGKKTDRRDSVWLAERLQHGLRRSSFVPPTPIRELRDLTRYRVTLCQECNRIANRIQKVLEDANVKLASRDGSTYRDLGPDYFDTLDPARLQRKLVKRLEGLGFQVTLTAQELSA